MGSYRNCCNCCKRFPTHQSKGQATTAKYLLIVTNCNRFCVMGCSSSSYRLIEKKIPRDWLVQFKALHLQGNELTKLFHIFKSIDRDQRGSVDVKELLDYLDLEDSEFSKRTFSVFDVNGSGHIDLREFILSLWNYCTLTQASLDIFTFDLYDTDASGILSFSEVENMVKDLYGKNYHHNPNARL
jgi:Ca2+-binding EF-hand superfamily protein